MLWALKILCGFQRATIRLDLDLINQLAYSDLPFQGSVAVLRTLTQNWEGYSGLLNITGIWPMVISIDFLFLEMAAVWVEFLHCNIDQCTLSSQLNAVQCTAKAGKGGANWTYTSRHFVHTWSASFGKWGFPLRSGTCMPSSWWLSPWFWETSKCLYHVHDKVSVWCRKRVTFIIFLF
jgi:hypothetical protein